MPSSSSSSPDTSAFSCPALAMSCARSCSSVSETALGCVEAMTRGESKVRPGKEGRRGQAGSHLHLDDERAALILNC